MNQKTKDHLICFDMDGVLIHSMVVANKIFYEVVSRMLDLPLYDYPQQKRLMALSAEERMQKLWTDDIKKQGITKDQIEAALQQYRDEKMAVGIPLLPHAKEAVMRMAENFEFLACVSSNPEYIIEETLEKLELRPYFSKITGIDYIQFSKPHPEIYAVTADHFGIDPKNALVVEDSTYGIQSAKSAGMKVLAVATGLESVEDLQKSSADTVLQDLSGLNFDPASKLLL